jgi:metal-responsive CopG/Arc/MetJ family transcriptional regulator
MRWQESELAAIDEWLKNHGIDSRPEAIRRLVQLGLKKGK